VKGIFKKYAAEIVTSDVPLILDNYRLVPVGVFQELLKLAINLNKHIMCCHNENAAISH
jgi:hypothetical protein